MTRPELVPNSARKAFLRKLAESCDHAEGLPNPLPLGCVLTVVDDDVDTEESLKVLAGKDERGWFLDYYRVDQDRDGETSSHNRIRQDGTLERLENFEGQWGRQIFPDDPARTEAERQRIYANNDRVREILREKGFR